MSESTYRHFYGKALDAARGGYDVWRAQSTGERVSVALALNRADWLEKIGYTIAEASAASSRQSTSTSRIGRPARRCAGRFFRRETCHSASPAFTGAGRTLLAAS